MEDMKLKAQVDARIQERMLKMKKFNATLAAEKKDRDAKSKIEEENVKAGLATLTKKLPAKKQRRKTARRRKPTKKRKKKKVRKQIKPQKQKLRGCKSK